MIGIQFVKDEILRKESLFLVGVIAAGLAGCSAPGMPYVEAQGSDLATVRVASQDTRILQVDGMRVPGYLPKGLTIAGGIRYIGIETSARGASMRQCMMLLAKSGQNYLIRVAGPERDWAISISGEGIPEGTIPLKVVQNAPSCPSSK